MYTAVTQEEREGGGGTSSVIKIHSVQELDSVHNVWLQKNSVWKTNIEMLNLIHEITSIERKVGGKKTKKRKTI